MRIQFGQWTPDRPGVSGNLTEAKNIYPTASGYASLNGTANLSDAASQNLLTVFPGRWAGATTLFAAGATKIFKFDPADADLDDVSRTPTAYSTTDFWQFCQFGSQVIASNGVDKLQAWNMASSTRFADLAAAAPTASFVTVVRDFVVAGKTSTYPNRVLWSDINDETDWTPGAASQSDTQDIPDGGEIRGITGGEFGVVLMERGLYRMTYIGAPLFFQFDNIARNVGCYESRSIAQYGPMTFFLSDDGFFMTDGQQVKPIGAERVDRWFYANADPSQFSKMSAAVDPVNKLVLWCFRDIFNVQKLLIYNWSTDRWSHGDSGADYISSIATASTTLEQLDNISASLDALPASLDSRLWTGGKLILGGVSGARIVTFAGTDLTGTINTGDITVEGQETLIRLARPQIDNGSATVSVSSRKRLDGAISYSAAVAADSENRVSLRSRGNYHRLSITPTGNYDTAVGVDVDIVPVGGR